MCDHLACPIGKAAAREGARHPPSLTALPGDEGRSRGGAVMPLVLGLLTMLIMSALTLSSFEASTRFFVTRGEKENLCHMAAISALKEIVGRMRQDLLKDADTWDAWWQELLPPYDASPLLSQAPLPGLSILTSWRTDTDKLSLRFLFFLFDLKNRFSLIISAMRAYPVRQLRFFAIRTGGNTWKLQFIVSPSQPAPFS